MVWVVVVSSVVFGWWGVLVSLRGGWCDVGGRLILAAEGLGMVWVVVVSSFGEVGVEGWYLQVGLAGLAFSVSLKAGIAYVSRCSRSPLGERLGGR